MSDPPSDRAIHLLGPGPQPEGDTPVGLYWGMPLAVAGNAVGVGLSVWARGVGFWSVTPWFVLLLAATVILAIRHRRWDARHQERRVRALQALTDLASATGPEAEMESEVLRRLPEGVRTMFGMKLSYVCMVDEDEKTVRIVNCSEPEKTPVMMAVDDLPMTRQSIVSGQVQAVSDTREPSRPVNAKLAEEANIRSILQIPMVVRGKTIGVMVLGDPRPREFTRLDLKRASLWGSQAGMILSNCRLYAKMGEALQEQRQIMAQRDELYAVNTAIHRPGSLEEVLQRIADLAPGPLGLDAVLVWLRAEDDPNMTIVAAATKPYDEACRGFRMSIAQSRAASCWVTGEPLVIEDGRTEPKLHPHLRNVLPSESIVFEPLLDGDGRALGLLSMLRRRSGAFTPDQLNMARLFSMRASAAIETARLNQQTSRDADDKAMLLRELNHRVKNNLAGIVSLLSINQPELPPMARDWLDRAVERISAMAQVHDLLSGGTPSTTVAELVERTTRSLLLSRTSGVTVRTDLPAGAARLRSERAVSLAMAMHELCRNGIVHGLPDGGTLIIRARQDDSDLVVEIEDDNGLGRPAVEPIENNGNGHGHGSGIG